MAEPLYYLQLVDKDGQPVTSPCRALKHRNGTLAIPIIEETLARVGWWRSKARLKRAMQDAIQTLKDETRTLVG